MKAKRSGGPTSWDDLRILLAVERQGSFLAAARELDVVTSTVSRRVAAMERVAQTPLVERRTDGVQLTHAGQTLIEAAERIELDVAAAFRDIAPAAGALKGTIRISTGDGFADQIMAAIAHFTQRFTEVKFELIVEARVANVGSREADLAIRTFAGEHSTLIYRRIGELHYGLWAANEYVARAGRLRSVRDLGKHQFVGVTPPLDRLPGMLWLSSLGVNQWSILCGSFAAQLSAVRAGMGISALPRLAAEGLVELLPAEAVPGMTVYLVSNRAALRKPHIRAFADLLFGRMQEMLSESER